MKKIILSLAFSITGIFVYCLPAVFAWSPCYYEYIEDEVFFCGDVLPGADVSSFEALVYPYSKDNIQVFYEAKVVEGANPLSIEVVDDGPYIKDSNNVYCEGEFLSGDVENFSQVEVNTAFAIDSENVYYGCMKLENSDPDTLVQIDNDFFRDKNNVYYQGNILNVDMESFEVLGGGYARDVDSVYFRYDGAVAGADRDSFLVKESVNDPVNGECGDVYFDAYDDLNCYGNGILTAERSGDLNLIKDKPYFTDVEKDSLNYMYEKGIFTGYEDGSFGYDNYLTRAELLKIVMVAVYMPADSISDVCFSDVQGDDWYVPYVCAAKEVGYISGYPDGSFKPNEPVNKVEALKMIAEALNWDIKSDLVGTVAVFNDTYESEWYFKYVINALDKFYIEMTASGKFDPSNFITRGDAAEILFRTLVSNMEKSGEGFDGRADLDATVQKFLVDSGTL